MKKTNQDLDPKHNALWLIDEKFVHLEFLSDITQNYGTEDECRPDVVVFGRQNETTYKEITIIEFKRLNESYLKYKDIQEQLEKYANQVKNGKIKKGAKTVNVEPNSHIYLHYVGTIDNQLREDLLSDDWHPLFASDVYFKYKQKQKFLCFYHDIDRLVVESHKRNKVFFDILKLQSNT
jgi:hypothetical protein